MISAGVEGRLPYMTYSEPWSRNPTKQPPEVFLRPAPKLLPPATRCTQEPSPIFLHYRSYNGINSTTTFPNGTRIAPSRPISKYPSPPPTAIPVNLTQPKEEIKEDPLSPYSPYRVFPHSPQYSPFSYPALCQPSYLLRSPAFPPTPLSPQEIFSPGTPTASSTATFLPPPATFSPPSTIVKTSQSREKRTSPVVPHSPLPQSPSFKVPSGKEGSMKHRILTRPEDAVRNSPLDLQKPPEGRKRLTATISPPRSPKKHWNNNMMQGNYQKGQLIQLASGDCKRIEDMRTEDFLHSAEKSCDLRMAESTVVKIEEGKDGNLAITLTYEQRKSQVEIDSTPEHPYFVIGHGWASCDPDRTLQRYGLKVHRLRVGDVIVSLTPRAAPPSAPQPQPIASRSTTIMTTATTTAMSARQYSVNTSTPASAALPTTNFFITSPAHPTCLHRPLSHSPPKSVVRSPEYIHPVNYYAGGGPVPPLQNHPLQLDSESRKRRWSAPDAIEEDELASRRGRVE